MDYIAEGRKPPKSKQMISTPEVLVEKLTSLIGQKVKEREL